MSRKKSPITETVSPYPTAYSFGGQPAALEREVFTRNQVRWDEDTLKWGDDDAFPIRIVDAVNQSPTATSCIGTIQTFIKGSGFSDPDLMNLKIDRDGNTLWSLHCALADYLAILDGFAVNFKFDSGCKIASAYLVNLETIRFKKPVSETSKTIDAVRVNPYFGTLEYSKEFSKEYKLWNPLALPDQIKAEGIDFPGQIYFYGSVRPPFKFYPIPRYWAGHQWIYVDGQIQQFHKANLDNGFFQSVLMTQIGDPNELSRNPKYKVTETATDGVTKIDKFTRTVGQEFDEQMSTLFSGVKKAGSVFNVWAKSTAQAPTIQPFPTNANFDVLAGTFTDAIRGITIATEVPAILANLPQQSNSLGSDGNAMSMAIQIMQTKTKAKRNILETFYNNILLPNLQDSQKLAGKKVEILEYSPIASAIDFHSEKAFELYWTEMNPQERFKFIQDNISEIKLEDRPVVVTPAPGTVTAPTEPAPMQINDNLKNLTGRQNQNLARIVRDFAKGKTDFTMARLLLKQGFGVTDEEINEILGLNEELNPISVLK